MSSYIATRAGGHFTAKEFRTWNATVLMALVLANAGLAANRGGGARAPSPQASAKWRSWLGDTPSVARGSYIDPQLISRYMADGQLAVIPRRPAAPPAAAEAEIAVAALLSGNLS